LDVREITEYEDDGRIPRAVNAYVRHIQDHVSNLSAEFPKAEPVVVTCSVGHRGSLAMSILNRNGYSQVFNLLGGMDAWDKQNLATKKGSSEKTPLDQASIEKDFPHEKQ
jgi:hydroxyacylglutathione hydrolase